MTLRKPQNPQTSTAPAVRIEKTSRPHVTVACKLPVSGFEMQLCVTREVEEQGLNGIRKVRQNFKIGEIHVLRGTAYPRGNPPEGFPERPQIVGGAALTHGIPRAFWEQWLDQNKQAEYVKAGFIFAHEDVDHVVGKANEEAMILTGLEPLNVRTVGDGENKRIADQRVPRSTVGAVKGIAPDEESISSRRAGAA